MEKLPDDIAKIRSSIEKLKEKEMIGQPIEHKKSYFSNQGLGFQMSIELFAGTAIGGAIGYFLDDLFDFKPFLLIIFLLIGGAAGFLNAYRTAKSMQDNLEE